MSAIDDLVAELKASRFSEDPQTAIARIDTFVAALEFIQGGLGPSGPEAANSFLAGPTSGAPATPSYRGIVAPDLGIFTLEPSFKGLVGVTDASNAPAGDVGQFPSVLMDSGVAIATSPTVVTQLDIPAGDWDVYGNAFVSFSLATGISFSASLSLSNSAFPDGGATRLNMGGTAIGSVGGALYPLRLSVSATTTVFLIAAANAASGTASGRGAISARRRR